MVGSGPNGTVAACLTAFPSAKPCQQAHYLMLASHDMLPKCFHA